MATKNTDWKDIAELVGIATIVASLIFVGIELRQSQMIATASQYQSRIGFNLQFYDSFGEVDFPRVGDRLKQQVIDSSVPADLKVEIQDMDSSVLGREAVFIRKILYMFDNNHYQHQAGFVDDESWKAMRGRLLGTMKSGTPLARALMRFEIAGRSHQWRESLSAELEQMLLEADARN
jgi:hypothetical protein